MSSPGMKGNKMDPIQQEVLPGVTTEAAAPIDSNLVQPTAQSTEVAAQATVEGLGTTETQESIPYDRFKEVNDSNKALNEQLLAVQQHNQNLILQNNNMQQVQQQPQTQSRLDQFVSKLSEVDDDGNGAININEAKEMASAIKEEFSNIKISQQENLATSFLSQNPDYTNLVGQDIPGMGFQYAPEFIKIIQSNPAASQQLASMAGDPIGQARAALQLATEHKRTTIGATLQQPVVNGLPNTAPPSLSAIPTPMGTSSTAANYGAMNNADFDQMARQMARNT